MTRLQWIATMLGAALAGNAAILDRIAVTVGKQVITETDVVRDVRVSAFLDQTPVVLDSYQKRRAADRLVDQILILQEAAVSRIPLQTEEGAASMLAQVKSGYKSDTDYQDALVRYGITEEDVTNHLLAGVKAMRYTDLRFRPEVQLSDEEVHDFYNSMAAESRQKGLAVSSFEESRADAEKLLTDQRTAQALDRWLGAQRNETQILYHEQVFE